MYGYPGQPFRFIKLNTKMKYLKSTIIGRTVLVLLFTAFFSSTYAQWDYEYQVNIQMTQKPLSNSLVEAWNNVGLFGVSNDANGQGFWIHWTDINGNTIKSYYYMNPDATIRIHGIEHFSDIVYTTGEMDYGNGQKDLFIMASGMNGGVIKAVVVPFGVNSTGHDMVKTFDNGTSAKFAAVGYIDNSPFNKYPYIVYFDNTLLTFTAVDYKPNTTGLFFVPTQAKMLDCSSFPNRMVVVGNDEVSPVGTKGLFKMRINTNTGNIIGSIDRMHQSSVDIYDPSVCATAGASNVLIASTYSTSSTVSDAFLQRFPASAIGPATHERLYDNNSGNEQVIQIQESSLGNAVLSYNNINGSSVLPNIGRISLTMAPLGTIVVSNTEYQSVNSPRTMHVAYSRETGASEVFFECTTVNSDVTRTRGSSIVTPCETYPDLDYVSSPTTSLTTSPVIPGSHNTTIEYEVDEYVLTGARYVCDGTASGTFKKDPTSIAELDEAADLIQMVAPGQYEFTTDEATGYDLYDLNGRLVQSKQNAQLADILDLNHLPSGVYVITINRPNEPVARIKLVR